MSLLGSLVWKAKEYTLLIITSLIDNVLTLQTKNQTVQDPEVEYHLLKRSFGVLGPFY